MTTETVWAIRGLPLNDELYLRSFLDVRAQEHLLPYPRAWFIQKIHEHFMTNGGPLRLVSWTVEEAEAMLKCEDPNEPIVILVRHPGLPLIEFACLPLRSA